MQEIVGALAEQQDELAALLADLDDDGWATPSACEGWSVADVVLHLAQTNEMATGSARGDLAAVARQLTEGLPPVPATSTTAPTRWSPRSATSAPPRSTSAGSGRAPTCAPRCSTASRATASRGSWATWPPAPSAPPAWPRRGSTPATSPTGSASSSCPPTASGTSPAWPGARSPTPSPREGLEPPGPVAFELTAPSGADWTFRPDGDAPTVIRGPGYDLCRVASRRVAPADTALTAEGPDARRGAAPRPHLGLGQRAEASDAAAAPAPAPARRPGTPRRSPRER